MVFYDRINRESEEGKRTAARLLKLREALEGEVPRRNIGGTLLLATWNIREFDSPSYGERRDEPLYYIAEIIDHFDLVAIQEVRDSLKALERLMDLLGSWWKYLLTDVTEGTPGNRERMAFLYDSRKVRFGGLAGEVVIPATKKSGNVLEPARQLARTPFLVGFGIDWFRCTICTTHILYGKDDPADPRRLEEIRMLATFLADRAREIHAWAKNMILLGDFNIFDTGDLTMKAITDAGFTIPEPLRDTRPTPRRPSTTTRSSSSPPSWRTTCNSPRQESSTTSNTSIEPRTNDSTPKLWVRSTVARTMEPNATSRDAPRTTGATGEPTRCPTTCPCGFS
jgi:hypothetical protein